MILSSFPCWLLWQEELWRTHARWRPFPQTGRQSLAVTAEKEPDISWKVRLPPDACRCFRALLVSTSWQLLCGCVCTRAWACVQACVWSCLGACDCRLVPLPATVSVNPRQDFTHRGQTLCTCGFGGIRDLTDVMCNFRIKCNPKQW